MFEKPYNSVRLDGVLHVESVGSEEILNKVHLAAHCKLVCGNEYLGQGHPVIVFGDVPKLLVYHGVCRYFHEKLETSINGCLYTLPGEKSETLTSEVFFRISSKLCALAENVMSQILRGDVRDGKVRLLEREIPVEELIPEIRTLHLN